MIMQQGHQPHPRHRFRQRRRFWVRTGIVFFVVLVLVAALFLFVKYYADSADSIVSTFIGVFSLILAVMTLAFTSNPSDAGPQGGGRLQIGHPPTADPMVISRKESIDKICQVIESRDTSCVKLSGISGIGKSTIAVLIADYAKTQRTAHNELFFKRFIRFPRSLWTTTPIWLNINNIATFQDFSDRLFYASKKSGSDLEQSSPQHQAREILQLLQKGPPRLIFLDFTAPFRGQNPQFLLCADPAFKELLKALNSQPCGSCIIMTDCPCDLGGFQGIYPLSRIKEFQVKGLTGEKGIELLKKHNLPAIDTATDKELRDLVSYYGGHPGALMLVIYHLHLHPSVSINDILEERYSEDQLPAREREIYEKFVESDYQRLTIVQSEVLRSFAVYRRPVPLEGGLAVIDKSLLPREEREIKEAIDTLVRLDLIMEENGRFLVPALVANCALTHFDNAWQSNESLRKTAHEKAALYYQGVVQRTRSLGFQQSQTHLQIYEPIKASLCEACKHYIRAGMEEEAIALVRRERLWNDIDFNI